MTLTQLASSLLVEGDHTDSAWDKPWRAKLVVWLGVLAGHLKQVGIDDIFLDCSFCSDKQRPGDIDGYFVTDFPAWRATRAKLIGLDGAWDLSQRRPDAAGKPKPLMWHDYHVELFPVFRPPFAELSSAGGNPPVTIDKFFRQSRGGEPRGVVRLLPEGALR